MKFHALALCLAGTMATGIAWAGPAAPVQAERIVVERRAGEFPERTRLHLDEPLYPDLLPVSEVARKVSRILAMQAGAVSELCAYAPAARTAGFDNVALVYDHLAADHTRIINWGTQWLTARGYPAPAMPHAPVPASFSPPQNVDDELAEHIQLYNTLIAMRQGEPSSTVRGLLLWSATVTANHISILRALDRDVDAGRRTASATLTSLLNPSLIASSDSELIATIIREEMELIERRVAAAPRVELPDAAPAPEPVVVERVVEKPVIVEKIVEKPVIVEKIVEKPVIVERIVEKPVIVERIVERPVPTRVLGRREAIRSPRARRPAK